MNVTENVSNGKGYASLSSGNGNETLLSITLPNEDLQLDVTYLTSFGHVVGVILGCDGHNTLPVNITLINYNNVEHVKIIISTSILQCDYTFTEEELIKYNSTHSTSKEGVLPFLATLLKDLLKG